ncbi:LOW QUALITY PROTEIN: zinc finger homeobox protein 3-like [Oncorhynchus tshawytscha]|uniref:LOW QUALITY PROTEIN: zinc finger homeobox protein 3-like n=1 Tax=Oncorhynchus tshawytscha TaxID=74940 RepID=UPI001C3E2ACE|nr:LOW QUALITY PROTEIN: zinc finger homeobox protein 3-like [Oncorhynchus tshawytscha]
MDIGEGGRGKDGGREGGEPDISTKPLSHPLLTPEVVPSKGSPSRTSAPAPAKEPSNLTQTEQGGAEGTAGREETPEGERGIYSQNGGVTLKEEQEKEEKLNEKKEKERLLLVDDREETGRKNLAEVSSKDRGEEEKEKEEEEEREEAISNQSQTKSKCSLLPRQSLHSSASSTVMASGTLNSNIHITASNSPKHSTSPSTCPKLSLSPSNSPKHSTSPFTSPKRSSFFPSSPYPQNETEVRDTGEVQGNSPCFPLSFKPQQSALSKSTSPPAKDDGRADATHTSLIANGDTTKVPKPNNNPEVRDGDREMEIERDDGEKEREGDENIETVSKYLHSSPSSSSSPSSPVSLNSHMALMQSRNSCKTLKCPKCNWHYKSQQTLQVHLREKHPESGGSCVCGGLGENCVCGGSRGVCLYCSTGKAHPRLSRGESYVCGYKPYRCGVCDYATSSKGNLSIHMQSDKHLSNVQTAGQTQHAHSTHTHSTHSAGSTDRDTAGGQVYGHTHPEVTLPPENTPPYPSHPSSQGKRWRCEVCDYETSIARNLRIHTTSEKHTQNVLRLKHTHNVLQLQRSYYLAHCRSLPPQLTLIHSTGGEQSLDMHQLTAEEPVAPDSTLTPSPSPPPSSSPSPSPSPSPLLLSLSPSPPPPLSLSSPSPLYRGVFRCLVCFSFSSDSLESLGSHLSAPRSLPQSEWRCLVAGGCYCRLCGYSTPLTANFTLHCQTDRHRARYQLAAHLWERGEKGEAVDWEEVGKLVATGNLVQLKCNVCDFQTTSLEKLRIHSVNSQHQASLRVYMFLEQYDSAVAGGSWSFHCVLCNYSSRSKLHLLRHTHSTGHHKREELHRLQLVKRRSLNKGEDLAAIFSIRKCTSPEIDGSSEEGERRDSLSPAKRSFSWLEETQSPLSPKCPRTDKHTTDQHTTAKCPLCQDTLVHIHLRRHLTLTHSVAQDCVEKLMSTVAVDLPEILQKETLQRDSHSSDSNTNEYQTNDSNTIVFYAKESLRNESQSNDSHMNEEEVIPAKDVPALPTRPCEDQHLAEDNTSHLPESPSSSPSLPTPPSPSLSHLPSSALPPSPPSDAPPSSDRHCYRFRCGRCSLAFRTQEKLKLHWQYHAMRAATECHLCPRRCRSQEALQRHLLNTHLQDLHLQSTYPDQIGAHIQRPTSLEGEEEEGESMSEEDEEEGNEGEEDEKDDPDEEERPSPGVSNSDMGSGQQEAGSEPSPLIKGSNLTLDRFLDPARPYKCSVCCESFTQRTILLVHYNSVSHLHRAKARRALHDSSPSHADTPQDLEPSPYRCSLAPDPRPYRCRMCGVAYSQSSTLDIHLRSVLHQTRARAARAQLPLNPHTHQTPASASTQAPHTPVPSLVQTQTPASSPSPGGGEASTRGNPPAATRPAPAPPSPCSSLSEAQLSVGVSGQVKGQQAKRRRVEDLTASAGQQDLMLLQQQLAQAQILQQQQELAQAQIEQHTVLLQPQLFSPTLLPHLPLLQHNLLKQHLPSAAEILQHGNLFPPLPLSPDSLFSLQQQLLLSFYLSGGLHLNPNTTLMNQTTSAVSPQTTSALSPQTTSAVSPQTTSDQHPQIERLEPPSPQPETNGIQLPAHAPKCETQAETAGSDSPLHQTEKEFNPSSPPEGDGEKNGDMQESEKKERAEKALRVLLERYGWELALQSTQSRQRQQNREMEGCLEEEKQCGECGKLFSDSLILKSHQEFVHRQMIPPVVLEMFSRQYRLQYDRLYPLRPFTPGDTETTVVAPLTPASASAPALAPLPPAPASDSTLDQAQSLAVSQTSVPALSPAATLTTIDTDPAVPPPPASVSVTLSPDHAPVNSLFPVHARASPTPSPPPSPCQPQPLSEQDSTTTTNTPCPDPCQAIIHKPKLSLPPLPLPQLPLPRLPLSNLSSLPFPIDPSLLPIGLMQPIALQSMLQYQSLLSSCHQPPLSLYTNTHSAPSPALPPYTTTHSAPSPALPPYTTTHSAPSPALPPYTNTHSAPSLALPPYTTTHSASSLALPPYITTHCAPSPALPPYTTTHSAPSPALPPYTTTHSAPCPALPPYTTTHSAPSPALPPYTTTHSAPSPALPPYTTTHSAPSPALPPYTTTHSAPSPALPPYTTTHSAPSPALPPYTTTHSAPSPALPPYTTTQTTPSPALPPYTTTHSAPSPALPPYTTTHSAPSPALPPYTTTHSALSPALPSLKRRLEEGTEVRPMSDVMAGDGEEGGEREGEGDEQRRDRRQRTTISAEQLEVLYQRYSLNSNPTRSALEGITRDTGLKKRVVQVWFQNTRARQRKGQLQTLGRGGLGVGLGDNHRRCPFCRALFKAQSALDAHVRARHWSQTDRPAYGLSHQIGSADDFSFSHNHGSYRDREGPPLSLQHSPSLSHHPSLPTSLHPSLSPGVIPTERKYISGKTDLTFDLNEPDLEEEEEEEGLSVKIFPSSDQAHEGNDSNLLSLGYKYGMASFNVQDCDQNSSPSLSESVDRHGPRQQQQQRQRTQMTPQQVAKLRACYREHPTPSPMQCEGLGRQLGLPRRVVQVWFQNGRAKEKRARSLRVDPTTG